MSTVKEKVIPGLCLVLTPYQMQSECLLQSHIYGLLGSLSRELKHRCKTPKAQPPRNKPKQMMRGWQWPWGRCHCSWYLTFSELLGSFLGQELLTQWAGTTLQC